MVIIKNFPICVAPNELPFVVKSIGKVNNNQSLVQFNQIRNGALYIFYFYILRMEPVWKRITPALRETDVSRHNGGPIKGPP